MDTHSTARALPGGNCFPESIRAASHNPSHKVGSIRSYEVEPTGPGSEYIQVSGLMQTLWTPWVALEKPRGASLRGFESPSLRILRSTSSVDAVARVERLIGGNGNTERMNDVQTHGLLVGGCTLLLAQE